MNQDEAVRATNDDASSCKKSAVDRGYWKDPYIQYFIRSHDRKAPEINRGYFARVHGIQTLIKKFLQCTECRCQIINLGAGFDTSYWNLKDEGLSPTQFVEVDFQGVTSKKCYYIKSRQQLLEKLQSEGEEIQFNKWDMHSPNYHIVGGDLRNVQELHQKLDECQVDRNLPTLFVAECVLIYMSNESSKGLVSWIGEQFPTVFFVNYEQVNMGDRFGQVMIENLKGRGCSLQGLDHCQSLETQKQRFLSSGWEFADAIDMNMVYHSLPQAEVNRIEKLEFLDEKEMLTQLFDHYCICWAFKDRSKIGLQNISFSPS